MFCCFKGSPTAYVDRIGPKCDLRPTQQNEGPIRGSLGAEPGKATALLQLVGPGLSNPLIKGSYNGANGARVANEAVLEGEDSSTEPAQQLQGVWAGLVEGLHTNVGKPPAGIGNAGAPGDDDAHLRLPAAGSAISLPELLQRIDALSDPVALVTFDRAHKRTLRSQRVSPHLVMDINLEALFAGGVVSPACRDTGASSGQQSLEAAVGLLPAHAVLHLLQRHYCNAESIRLSVQHSNSALKSLLGCQALADYEGLLAELLSTEHMMRAVLHDCCLCMLEGVTASSSQLMVHHPIRNTASRMVLPMGLHPVLVWRRPPGAGLGGGPTTASAAEVPTMAVVVRYNLSAGLHDALQQLHRVYAMLSSLSGIVTLFTLRGRVLHQNTASVRYMGLRGGGSDGAASAVDIHTSVDLTDASGLALGSLLRHIFALSSEQLDDMLEDVVEGKTWKGIVKVPPLLTPTIDPGPAQAALLAARGLSGMTVGGGTPMGSSAQVMTTWDRIGPVLMSTQPGMQRSTAQAANQSDVEQSEMGIALMMTDAEKSVGGPADDRQAGNGAGTAAGGAGAGALAAAVLRANASTLGVGLGRHVNGGGDMNSAPDSCMYLAMGSTSGTTCSKLNLQTQGSSLRMALPQRTLLSRMSSNDLPDGAALSAALSAPGGGTAAAATAAAVASGGSAGSAGGGGGAAGSYYYIASKLSGSAPVVPSSNPRAQSAARAAGTSLLRTLMENGTSIIGEMERASSTIGFPGAGSGGSGGSSGLLEEQMRRRQLLMQVQLQQGEQGLTDAARRSIVRRRSALKLVPAATDDNPLSTSTWGLFDNHRGRGESKSFTLRRNNILPTAIKRVGTDRQLERSESSGLQNDATAAAGAAAGTAVAAAAATTAGSLTSGGSAKKRPPSRLMSFLANKNIGGAPAGSASSANLSRSPTVGANNVLSASAGADGASGSASGGGMLLKGTSSTTELEISSRQGSSLGNRGGPLALGIAAAAGGGSGSAPIVSARRPPTRRLMRPAIDDVAEESGTECSGRLPSLAAAMAAANSTAGGGVAAAALPQMLAVIHASNASRMSRAPTAGQLLQPSQAGIRSEHESAGGDEDDDCWHEITASTLRDPVSGEQALLLMQMDVSARVKAERRIAEVLEAEHKLLESVFPRHVLELAATRHTGAPGRPGLGPMSKFSLVELPLAQNCASVATYHPMVTILFSDIIGFTNMCHEIPATKVMEFLNNLYSRLDTLLDVYGVYKVETIGDCYMVAGGLMTRDADGFMTVRPSDSLDELHAAKVMSFAKAMLRETSEIPLPTTGEPVQMRIGLHSGPVMSGIVGSKMPRFCLFGDTVNTASRMESTCPPGSIHVSTSTREFLADEDWEPTGGVMVKGKGVMSTFRWIPMECESSPLTRVGGGGTRQNRPRRASSVAYANNVGGGAGAASRDGSGTFGMAMQAAGSGPMGLASGPGSVISSAINALQPSANGYGSATPLPPPPPAAFHAGRAASASVAFASGLGPAGQDGAHLPAGGAATQAGSPVPSSAGRGRSGLGSSAGLQVGTRRKPHRSCSTTALAYKGLARPT